MAPSSCADRSLRCVWNTTCPRLGLGPYGRSRMIPPNPEQVPLEISVSSEDLRQAKSEDTVVSLQPLLVIGATTACPFNTLPWCCIRILFKARHDVLPYIKYIVRLIFAICCKQLTSPVKLYKSRCNRALVPF